MPLSTEPNRSRTKPVKIFPLHATGWFMAQVSPLTSTHPTHISPTLSSTHPPLIPPTPLFLFRGSRKPRHGRTSAINSLCSGNYSLSICFQHQPRWGCSLSFFSSSVHLLTSSFLWLYLFVTILLLVTFNVLFCISEFILTVLENILKINANFNLTGNWKHCNLIPMNLMFTNASNPACDSWIYLKKKLIKI